MKRSAHGKTLLTAIAVLAFAGILFSGYLTYYTYASGQPGCELFFFNMPSCFYGMLMYLAVFLLALGIALNKALRSSKIIAITILSVIGIGFAASLTILTLSAVSCTSFTILGVAPCVYGFVMYLVILLLALSEISGSK